MSPMASQITSLGIVYSTVYSGADQRKHQSSASLAFVWGIHWDRWIPRTKGQLRGKCFHFMTSSCNAPFCSRSVHTHVHNSVTKWCIVGCGSGAMWDLCNKSVGPLDTHFSTFINVVWKMSRILFTPQFVKFQWVQGLACSFVITGFLFLKPQCCMPQIGQRHWMPTTHVTLLQYNLEWV